MLTGASGSLQLRHVVWGSVHRQLVAHLAHPPHSLDSPDQFVHFVYQDVSGQSDPSLRDRHRDRAGMGAMILDGNACADAVRTLLAGSMEKVRGTAIDLTKTYTNEFVHGR